MAKLTISYELDPDRDDAYVRAIVNARECHDIFYKVDNLLRQKIKHGDDEWMTDGAVNFLEEIREAISDANIYE